MVVRKWEVGGVVVMGHGGETGGCWGLKILGVQL